VAGGTQPLFSRGSSREHEYGYVCKSREVLGARCGIDVTNGKDDRGA
jgi:hypothetical protein